LRLEHLCCLSAGLKFLAKELAGRAEAPASPPPCIT
jgi:hypothetical protein